MRFWVESERPAAFEAPRPEVWVQLRAVRSAEGRIIDFDCLAASPDAVRQGVLSLLPTAGKRLLDEAPWVAECSLFDACVRVVERQVPELERFGRTTPAGLVWLQARIAPSENGLTLFLEDSSRHVDAEGV